MERQKMILAKKQFGIEWKNGDTDGLIKNCEDPEALRKILSEGFFQAFALYTNEVNKDGVSTMVKDMIEEYQFEPVAVLVETLKDIRKGKRKIFGRVTPSDLREMITEKLEVIAIERENAHAENKGYGKADLSPRTSQRNSDGSFPIAKLLDKNKL